MSDKSTRRPLIDPLLLLLRSRRMIVALCALAVGLLTLALPELAAVRAELLTLLLTLALAVIAGYTVEDAARVARERAARPADEIDALVRDLLDALLDAARAQAQSRRSSDELPF